MKRTIAVVAVVMVVIAVIDYFLGATAEHINGYEIARRTFGLPLPEVSERFVFGQDAVGRAALAWGWVVWTVEATVATGLLYGLATLSARALRWCAAMFAPVA